MAKISHQRISQVDLEAFVSTESDFAFEIEVHNKLKSMGASSFHGGTYEDPKTGKYREFDIRASFSNDRSNLRLAVECKNIKDYSPLLIQCVPRDPSHAYHEVVCGFDQDNDESNPYPKSSHSISSAGEKIWQGSSVTIRVSGSESIYKASDPVGKSCTQVARTAHDNTFQASDSVIYDKWSQAINSCHDLVDIANSAGRGLLRGLEYTVVVPVLVVPSGCLWKKEYNHDGSANGITSQADRVSYYVGAEINRDRFAPPFMATVSHLEVVTIDGINQLIESFAGNDGLFLQSLPRWYLDQMVVRRTQT